MGIIHYLVMCLAQVVLDNNYCHLKNQICRNNLGLPGEFSKEKKIQIYFEVKTNMFLRMGNFQMIM